VQRTPFRRFGNTLVLGSRAAAGYRPREAIVLPTALPARISHFLEARAEIGAPQYFVGYVGVTTPVSYEH